MHKLKWLNTEKPRAAIHQVRGSWECNSSADTTVYEASVVLYSLIRQDNKGVRHS